MTRENNAADCLHDGDLRKMLRSAPTIDRQRERATDANVVERLPLVVRREQEDAIPVALLYRDVFASAWTRSSRLFGGEPRNSIAAPSPRIACTRTACLFEKIASKPSR